MTDTAENKAFKFRIAIFAGFILLPLVLVLVIPGAYMKHIPFTNIPTPRYLKRYWARRGVNIT